MALIEFKNLPDTTTPINATNLNNNFNELANQNQNVLLKSINNITSLSITSTAGYGTVLIISAMFTCVLQLNNTTVEIKDIYGTHGTMSASISNNVASLTGLYNWDHYIFIGSSEITAIG